LVLNAEECPELNEEASYAPAWYPQPEFIPKNLAGVVIGRALHAACFAGHTNIVQYLLEDHFTVAKRLDIYKAAMPVAIRPGYRVMVDLFRSYGVELQHEHLMDCLKNRGRPRGSLYMVQHLLNAGVAVDREVFNRCEGWASNVYKARLDFRTIQSPVTEGAMATILVA
jgi:hypothetical protein